MNDLIRCPRCKRYTAVGHKVYVCLRCGEVTDRRRHKKAPTSLAGPPGLAAKGG